MSIGSDGPICLGRRMLAAEIQPGLASQAR